MLKLLPTRVVTDKPSTLLTDLSKLKSVKEFKFVILIKNNSNRFKTTSKEDLKPVATATRLFTHQVSTRQLRVPKTRQLPRATP